MNLRGFDHFQPSLWRQAMTVLGEGPGKPFLHETGLPGVFFQNERLLHVLSSRDEPLFRGARLGLLAANEVLQGIGRPHGKRTTRPPGIHAASVAGFVDALVLKNLPAILEVTAFVVETDIMSLAAQLDSLGSRWDPFPTTVWQLGFCSILASSYRPRPTPAVPG